MRLASAKLTESIPVPHGDFALVEELKASGARQNELAELALDALEYVTAPPDAPQKARDWTTPCKLREASTRIFYASIFEQLSDEARGELNQIFEVDSANTREFFNSRRRK